MQQIPDAPWIRDAERNGIDEVPDPICPMCKKVAERFYFYIDDSSQVIGCDQCITWEPAEYVDL